MSGRRRGALARLVVAALLGLSAGPVDALENTVRSGPVEVRVTLTPDEPVIGDALRLDIDAVAEPGVELLMPDFGEALDRFRIVDFVPRETVDADGRTLASQRYTLQLSASGEQRVPSVLVEFVDRRPGQSSAPEGQDAYELMTEPIAFSVASVLPDSASAELSPPLGRLDPIGRGAGSRWPWALGLLVVAAALGPLAWRAAQRWRSQAALRSAYEVARSELDALLASPHPHGEAVDRYFVALSGIVRRYLEARFAVRSPELTTERFLDVVADSPDLGDDHQALLRDFLRQCDLVKFAHVIPTEETIQQAVEAAGRFIEDTRGPTGPDAERPRREGLAA